MKTWKVARTIPHGGSSTPEHRAADKISFTIDGTSCVSTHQHGVIDLISARSGHRDSVFYSKEVGCSNATFTHHPLTILHSATTKDVSRRGLICYHSLYDNKIIRFFRGHTDLVSQISMQPKHDTFLSSGMDGKCILWDLRQPNQRAATSILPAPALASFHPDGENFYIYHNRHLAMYDVRQFDRGPSVHVPLAKQLPEGAIGRHITSSQDGSLLSLVCTSGHVVVVDATSLEIQFARDLKANSTIAFVGNSTEELLYGCQTGEVCVAKINSTGTHEVTTLGKHTDEASVKHDQAVTAVASNPAYQQLATADSAIAFWLPSPS